MEGTTWVSYSLTAEVRWSSHYLLGLVPVTLFHSICYNSSLLVFLLIAFSISGTRGQQSNPQRCDQCCVLAACHTGWLVGWLLLTISLAAVSLDIPLSHWNLTVYSTFHLTLTHSGNHAKVDLNSLTVKSVFTM